MALNQKPKGKAWTILIYANGNNELEPEMHQAMFHAEKAGSSPDVNVVIQLGRAKYELVKHIRQDTGPKNEGSWNGVRRYLVGKGNSNVVGNLERANMANPMVLYDFIKWGVRLYPADRYMLILGGHAYQFVGMMTDYTQKAPYIMGIPEMVRAIDIAANEAGCKIDILVMDTCYFNSIEVLYELGKTDGHSVRTVITNIINGPIEGLPYERIIKTVGEKSDEEDITAVIREIIDNLPCDLVAFEVDHLKLRQMKKLFNDIASAHLSRYADDGNISFEEVLPLLKNAFQAAGLDLLSLVLHFKRGSHNKADPLVIVANKPTDNPELISRYKRLAFAQDNCWTILLSNRQIEMNRPQTENLTVDRIKNLHPLKMRPEEVYAYISIMNPRLEETRKKEMLKELYQYRRWI